MKIDGVCIEVCGGADALLLMEEHEAGARICGDAVVEADIPN